MTALERAHALAATQHGVLTRKQAASCGVTDRVLARLLTDGLWLRLHPGVYSVAETTYLGRVAAGLLAVGATAVASHRTAGALHGFAKPVLPISLTLPRNTFRRAHVGIRLHRSDMNPQDVETVNGLSAATPTRTVLDVALAENLIPAVCFAERAIRSGALDAAAINVAFDASYRRRRGHRARRSLALVDPLSESELETRLRLLLVEHGLLPPERQWVVRDKRGIVIARADFAWPAKRLIVEADGRGPHELPEALLRDRRRQNALTNAGYRVLRFTWDDVVYRPEYVVATIRYELQK